MALQKTTFAAELAIPPREIDELVFGLALTGIQGAGKRPRSKGDAKPRLTVV
jgi:hypothetical protein